MRMDILHFMHRPRLLSPKALGYYLWLAKEIVISSMRVCRIIWQVKPVISPHVAWVPTLQTNDGAKTVYANSITLTPGTVAVDTGKAGIYIHALTKAGIDDLATGDMDHKITQFMSSKPDASPKRTHK